MALVYRRKCVFFRAPSHCVLCRLTCAMCDSSQEKIEGLELKDHVSLVMGRRSVRLSMLFSISALVISVLSLVFNAIKWYVELVK
jgi:hypothetical protein